MKTEVFSITFGDTSMEFDVPLEALKQEDIAEVLAKAASEMTIELLGDIVESQKAVKQ